MRIGWLSTGRDEAACELLADITGRAARDAIDLDIAVVFCDRERGESAASDRFLALADDLKIPAVTLSSAASWTAWWKADDSPGYGPGQHKRDVREAWRDAYHYIVSELLAEFRLDALVLAGYMLITSPEMSERFAMLNLHPALPGGPAGTWQEVIWELLRTDARETGAMIHLATAELDRGPVVSYCSFPIMGGRWDPLWMQFRRKRERAGMDAVSRGEGESEPLFAEVRRQGARREVPLLYQTIKQFAAGELCLVDGDAQAVDDELPVSLTDAVEAELETTP